MNSNITWNLSAYGSIDAGENFTIKAEVHVMSNASVLQNRNRACANATNLLGTSSGTTCDYADVWIYYPALTLTKTGNATNATPGDIVEYTITINNPKYTTAYNITISDNLQYGFKLISNGTLTFWNGTTTDITINETLNETNPPAGSTVYWNYTLPYILPQKSVTLRYNTSVTSDAKCGKNIVTINYRDGDGTGMPYIQAQWESCPVFKGVLTVDKITSDSLSYPGNNVTYEIIISNSGTETIYNITLNDTPPNNWQYANNIINLTNSTCNVTHNGTHFIVTGNLSPGAVCRFRYDVSVPDLTCFGEYYNYISAYAYYASGTMLNDSSYASTDIVSDCVLDVSKNINNSLNNNSLKYEYGSVIEFIINISSRGNTTIYNVTVNDTLPVGLQFINCTNETGDTVTTNTTGTPYAGQSVNFSAGNISGNSYKIFYIRATITDDTFEGTNINRVVVTGNGPCEPAITDTDFASFAVGIPELKVHKWADSGSMEPGEIMTYHVSITNEGTGTAYNITVTDTLIGMEYVSNSSVFNGSGINDPEESTNTLFWNSTTLNNTNLTPGSSVILDFNLTTQIGNCSVNMGIDEVYANASDGYGNIVSNPDLLGTLMI
ncbi:hypothetical protein BEH94_01210 [Candidatus Altiarchaeales archaeon WOR_SM1_SCG]|nr:hypothetical protein BEH94_01210 [Candidatus Altiarchaeales archaeon WOR_SM1_SCG]